MIGRRRVLALLGGATAAGLTSAGAWRWVAAQAPSGGGGGATPAPAPPPATPAAPQPPSEEAKALADVARRRYGTHLGDAHMDELTRAIDRSVQGASALAKVPLANADEPDSIFRA